MFREINDDALARYVENKGQWRRSWNRFVGLDNIHSVLQKTP